MEESASDESPAGTDGSDNSADREAAADPRIRQNHPRVARDVNGREIHTQNQDVHKRSRHGAEGNGG